jgi:hypothetical protein
LPKKSSELERVSAVYSRIESALLHGDASLELTGLFDKQLKAHRKLNRKQRRLALFCSRQSGKSRYVSRKLILSLLFALTGEHVVYGALTRNSAERIIWLDLYSTIRKLDLERLLGWKVSHSECSIETPHGAKFFLLGFSDDGEVGKLRGIKCRLVVLDEVQEYEDRLEQLIRGAVNPTFILTRGELILAGTPGDDMKGFWHSVTRPEVAMRARGYAVESWTFKDNPFVEDPEGWLREELEDLGVDESDPYVQKEYFGRWCADGDRQCYPNVVEEDLPSNWRLDDPTWVAENLVCTMGIDYGWDPDPCAWMVLAQERGHQTVYAVDEHSETRVAPDDWHIQTLLYSRKYDLTKIVNDPGGGKAMTDTFNEKYAHELGFHVEAPDKRDKGAQMNFLRIDFKAGRLKLAKGRCPKLKAELAGLRFKDSRRNDTKPGLEDHLSDALRYAWKAHPNAVQEAVQDKRKRTVQERLYVEQEEYNESMLRRMNAEHDPWSSDLFNDDGFDNRF